MDTLFETHPDVNAFFETQWDSKRKIITFASDRTTRITFPDPKAREIKSSGHILASKVGQNLGPTTFRVPAVAQSCSRRVSAPLSGCPGRCPGAPKTLLFLKETATFPLCAPHRFHTPAGTRPRYQKICFGTSAPPPLYPSFLSVLNHFFPFPSFRTPGSYWTPTPDPSGVGGFGVWGGCGGVVRGGVTPPGSADLKGHAPSAADPEKNVGRAQIGFELASSSLRLTALLSYACVPTVVTKGPCQEASAGCQHPCTSRSVKTKEGGGGSNF